MLIYLLIALGVLALVIVGIEIYDRLKARRQRQYAAEAAALRAQLDALVEVRRILTLAGDAHRALVETQTQEILRNHRD